VSEREDTVSTGQRAEDLAVETAAEPGPRAGSLAVAAVVLGVAVYLTYGLLVMDVPDAADSPGPRFFPVLVAALAYLLAVALVVDAFRHRSHETPEPRTATDWRAVAGIVATLVVFTLLLRPLGWMLAGTLLFWGVATFLGSRRHVFDAGLALGVASIVQLIFSAGLGLNLPAGVLGVF
jgi:putative tricarboxylic transport membrane protein